ncbi:MAG: Ig-like domain-containing protein [Blastocatellales bacterium]
MKNFHTTRVRPLFGNVSFRLLAAVLILLIAFRISLNPALSHTSQTTVVTVSAASFEASALAPGTIAAAFGASLATQVQAATTQPLPTSLAGTTVTIRDSASVDHPAPLFFVAPNQVNLLIPPQTATGAATITIKSGDGATSTGAMQINTAAPAIFTANSDGQGVPAAVLLRVKSNGAQITETLAQFDAALGRFKTKPIDFGPDGERVFLILFLTGINLAPDTDGDGNHNESVHLIIGGAESVPLYAGAQGDFAGLDQMNIELPRSLIGRGKLSLSINAPGANSNLVEIEAGSPAGASPPTVSGFSASPVLAGQTFNIQGSGFATTAANNLVRIGGAEASVVAAAANQLSVVVPFGVESGPVTVRTAQGEGASANPLAVRTSISGLVETTTRQPMPGVKLRLIGPNINTTTSAEGGFLLPDVPPGVSLIEVDASEVPASPPYPKVTLKITAFGNRDNQFQSPIALQQPTGPGLQVGSGNFAECGMRNAKCGPPAASGSSIRNPQSANRNPEASIQTGGVIFDLPDNATALFPDGATSGVITLTVVENSRTPALLPAGQFSSAIAQLTPFGVRLSPGGQLTFPNPDGFPAGARATLFRLDQTANSPTVGSFVAVGEAVVSGDGKMIETAPGAVTETSYYFVSLTRPTTTVVGRVVESDGKTSVRLALAHSRGQEAFTDGTGAFTLRSVPVNSANDGLTVEAIYVRPGGRIDRVQRSDIAPVVGGVTQLSSPLVLPAANSNRPPVILAPPSLTVTQGETRNVGVIVADLDQGQTISEVTSTGAQFAQITKSPVSGVFILGIAPKTSDAGNYTLRITAKDSAGGSATLDVVLRVNRAPIANSQTVNLNSGATRNITLTGSDADNDPLKFIVVSQPSGGKLSGVVPNLAYTPNAGFSGVDRFTFKVNDGFADSNTAAVAINVAPVITSLSPPAAPLDAQIQIIGAGFAPTAANNIVSFGGVSAQIVSANTAGTQLTVVVPRSLTASSAPVIVVANKQTSNMVTFFVINPAANLLRNGDAEEGRLTATGFEIVPIPGWTTTSNFTTPVYGIPGCMGATEGQRIGGGKGYFVGGPNNSLSTATQTVDVSKEAAAIDAKQRVAVLRAFMAGFLSDNATLRAEFLNAAGASLGAISLGPISATGNAFQLQTTAGGVPPGTRAIRVTMTSVRATNDVYNDGYFDNLFLGLSPN